MPVRSWQTNKPSGRKGTVLLDGQCLLSRTYSIRILTDGFDSPEALLCLVRYLLQGLLNVIDLRGQFGGFTGVPTGFDFADAIIPRPGKLIDYKLRDQAIKAAASGMVKVHER